MTIWKNCTMDCYYADGLSEGPCAVKIDGGHILIEYEDEGSRLAFTGAEEAPGHYRLTAQTHKGRATLHMFPNDDVLEGWWYEDNEQGMWRIHLDE